MNSKFLNRWLIFPVLSTINAVLTFYIVNFYEATSLGLVLISVVALVFLIITWLFFYFIFRDIKKSALVTFVTSTLFFSFQNIVFTIVKISMRFSNLSLVKFLFDSSGQQVIFWVFISFLVLIFVLVKKLDSVNPKVIGYLNLFSIILFIFTLFRGYIFMNRHNCDMNNFEDYWQKEVYEFDVSTVDVQQELPDIYYIIFDGFGRSDILIDLYDLDNSTFIDGLESRGFFVAVESYANYSQTRTSLASSLNMRYLDNASDSIIEDNANYYPLHYMVENSIVEHALRSFGYNMVSLKSQIKFTDFTDWDAYFKPKLIPDYFSQTFISTTAMSVFVNPQLYRWHYDTVNYVIETIPLAAPLEGPKFVFAHILSPHPPFVFDTDGTYKKADRLYTIHDASHFIISGSREEYQHGYTNQIVYLQNSILKMIDDIISAKDGSVIIILQGDHGPGMYFDQENLANSNIAERLAILNAIYFYDQDYDVLYPQISPVNTFRVIFSQYLNQQIPLIEDEHYYAEFWNFTKVDDLLYPD